MKMRACIMMFAVLSCISVIAKPTKSSVAARNGVGGSGNALPYDAEVEYLESTGTQYIVLPITAGQCYGFDLRVTDVVSKNYSAYVANGSGNDFVAGVNGNNVNNSYIRIRTSLTWANNTGANKHITAIDGVITANGTSIGLYDPSLSLANKNDNMGMFARSDGYINSMSSCRIMSYKLYGIGEELLLDVIPVRFTNELGQSEGAMYDRISGQLFRNQGTGAFLIGPDK